MIKKLDVKTHSRVDFLDITDRVNDAVKESGVEDGICVVYVPHTTAGVTINEHADPDVVADIASQLDLIVPQRGGYRHSEGNSAAHIKATLVGASATVFIQYGELAMGTWQGIFFCEFDGPRNRRVVLKVIADKK